MHVKAKEIAFGGLLLALSVVFMSLGSLIETGTFFLLAAASFFVGIVIRESGLRTGTAFYIAAFILGFFTAPNKLYVFTFVFMGFYILAREAVWKWLEKKPEITGRYRIYQAVKYVIFNIIYLPVLFLFRQLLFPQVLSAAALAGVIVGGQIVLFLYDRAYDYVQLHIWGRLRGKIFS